jgi:hypothetical protein
MSRYIRVASEGGKRRQAKPVFFTSWYSSALGRISLPSCNVTRCLTLSIDPEGEWCQEPFYFTLGFQPKKSGQFSIYITLQTRGQLAQLPPDQGARQRDQPMQPKNRGNAQSKILLA